jgi:hypothetical protein
VVAIAGSKVVVGVVEGLEKLIVPPYFGTSFVGVVAGGVVVGGAVVGGVVVGGVVVAAGPHDTKTSAATARQPKINGTTLFLISLSPFKYLIRAGTRLCPILYCL